MKGKVILILINAILFIGSCGSYTLPEGDYTLTNVVLGIGFPPVRNSSDLVFTKEHMDALNMKLMRIGEDWNFREPTKGEFNWSPLDARVAFAESNGYKLLVTVHSDAPEWARGDVTNERSAVFANDTDFSNYINTMAMRYSNRIAKVQFGNEWASTYWYAGTGEEFAHFNNILYDAFKMHSPETKVVLGGFACGTLRILAAVDGRIDSFWDVDAKYHDASNIAEYKASATYSNDIDRVMYVVSNAKYEMVDIHLYDDVEHWEDLVDAFTNLVPDMPIVVSELGGPNIGYEPYTEDYQAERLIKYIRKVDGISKIEEIYYFKLVQGGDAHENHSKSGLMDELLRKKPAYEVMRAFGNSIEN